MISTPATEHVFKLKINIFSRQSAHSRRSHNSQNDVAEYLRAGIHALKKYQMIFWWITWLFIEFDLDWVDKVTCLAAKFTQTGLGVKDFRRKRLKTVCEHWAHFDVKFNEVKVFWIKLKKNRRNIALGFTMKVKITLSLHWSDHTSDLHFTGMLLKIVYTENGENRRISFLKITWFPSSR